MRVAVIGMGSIGRRHAENLVNLGYRPIVYDTDLNACGTAFGQTPEWDTALSLQGLWEAKPAAVLICTPPDSHWALALDAIRNDCHCFIEKPLSGPQGHGVKDWKELTALADVKGLVNMVACNWRFAHGPRQIAEWIGQGVLGEILSARLYCGYSIDDREGYRHSYVTKVGATFDVGWHLADLAASWFGPAELNSYCILSANSIDLPEMDGAAELMLMHQTGCISSIHVNLLQRHYIHTAYITGREGCIGYDFTREHVYSRLWGKPYEDYRWTDQPDMFVQEIQHFLICCEQRTPTINPIIQNIGPLQLLLTAKEAKRCRK